jgi:AraC-like DNA-binding protein
MSDIRRRDGFAGEMMHVVPRPLIDTFAQHPLVYPLMPTDIGWFPTAQHHYRKRPEGALEHILILCVSGRGWVDMYGRREDISACQAVLIPKHTPHGYGASKEEPWSIHWVHFTGVAGDYYVQGLQYNDFKLSVNEDTARYLDTLFCRCRDAFIASFVLERMIYASQVLHHLLACLLFDNPAFSPLLRTSQFRSINASIQWMHANVAATLTLEQMAARAALSKSHFIRLFKQQTDYSPMDYFIHLKMQRACALLAFSQKTVREIALDIGYDDPYYFSRVFHKVVGVSPSGYRQQL